jgi:hypothetical protein
MSANISLIPPVETRSHLLAALPPLDAQNLERGQSVHTAANFERIKKRAWGRRREIEERRAAARYVAPPNIAQPTTVLQRLLHFFGI